MLVIRFFRVGKRNQPSFKIVVTDRRRAPRAGRFIEEVGFWNSVKKEKVLKAERIKYWISVGAKPSDTVYNLLVKEKIIEGKKIAVHKAKKVNAAEAAATAVAAKSAVPAPVKPATVPVPVQPAAVQPATVPASQPVAVPVPQPAAPAPEKPVEVKTEAPKDEAKETVPEKKAG